jgi:hypothetical protein
VHSCLAIIPGYSVWSTHTHERAQMKVERRHACRRNTCLGAVGNAATLVSDEIGQPSEQTVSPNTDCGVMVLSIAAFAVRQRRFYCRGRCSSAISLAGAKVSEDVSSGADTSASSTCLALAGSCSGYRNRSALLVSSGAYWLARWLPYFILIRLPALVCPGDSTVNARIRHRFAIRPRIH